MKYLYILIIIAAPLFLQAQVITTIAGNGLYDCTGDGGPAMAAALGVIGSIAVDTIGNIYLGCVSCHKVKKISISGIITTVAGSGIEGISGDGGAAIDAAMGIATGLAVDRLGNIYISDGEYNVIRKVDPSGIISTIAGDASVFLGGYGGDGGPATAAILNQPGGIAMDSAGNIYFADGENSMVRKISTSGIITRVAGNGIYGYAGDGGPATAASLALPVGITLDKYGNIYVSDAYAHNVRKIAVSGIITLVAGNGTAGYSGDGSAATAADLNFPQGICTDTSGNVFIADFANNVIRKVDTGGIITTFAGNGTAGHSGDGGLPQLARLYGPQGVIIDKNGYKYIPESYGHYVRKVDTCLAADVGTIIGTSVICDETLVSLTDSVVDGVWSVSDATIATISSAGMVNGIGHGGVTVSYAVTNSCVTAYAFKTLTVGGLFAGTIVGVGAYGIGDIDTFCYNAHLENAGGFPGGVWGLTNTTVATISGSGFITPHSYSYTDTAFYTVTDSCGSDTAFFPFIIVWCPDAVNHVQADEHEFYIYPNPACDVLTIASTTPITGVEIINPLGHAVYSQKYTGKKAIVNIAAIPPGIYLLRINDTVVKRLLKQ